MHFHNIIDCLTLVGVPTEPRTEFFKEAVSAFATSLLDNGNSVYKDYFSTPPHEHVCRLLKSFEARKPDSLDCKPCVTKRRPA